MKHLKRFLLAIAGEKRYLDLLAHVFQLSYRTQWLNEEYKDIYFLKKFIRDRDCCIDIGAHLGYFSLELSRLVQREGKVFAVEPISKFNKVLEKLVRRYNAKNITIYRVAIGGEGEYVEMGIPEVNRVKKFAYARIKTDSSNLQYVESEKVMNRSGDDLFGNLARLDFIKCDVEGFEFSVLKSFLATIKTHHPIILCEFFDRDERIKSYELLKPLGYQLFDLKDDKWHQLNIDEQGPIKSQNYYFIPAERRRIFSSLFAS